MDRRRIISLLCAVLTGWTAVAAQERPDRKEVRSGNRDFRKAKYKEAELDYRKALVKDSLSTAANYNLANTLYKMEDYTQAAKHFETAEYSLPAEKGNADIFFNKGNAALQEQNWNTAVEAFKQALLLNPADMDAKESYIYARKMLQDQQQNQQGQDNQNNGDSQNQNNQNQNNQNNQNNQDNQNGDNQDKQNQDNQNQNSSDNQNQQDRQNQENQNNGDGSGDQNQQPRQTPQGGEEPKISPQAAQQLLQAVEAKEKETQEKVKKAEALKMKSRQKDKNW